MHKKQVKNRTNCYLNVIEGAEQSADMPVKCVLQSCIISDDFSKEFSEESGVFVFSLLQVHLSLVAH